MYCMLFQGRRFCLHVRKPVGWSTCALTRGFTLVWVPSTSYPSTPWGRRWEWRTALKRLGVRCYLCMYVMPECNYEYWLSLSIKLIHGAHFLTQGSYGCAQVCKSDRLNLGNLTHLDHLTASWLIRDGKDNREWKSGGTSGHISRKNNNFLADVPVW